VLWRERLHAIEGEQAPDGGTSSGPPVRVTRATKSTMAFLVVPSFHHGSECWPPA